jgi:hemoglobin-like flavoprotein
MKNKIVFLKGGSNTGKSTAFRNLKKLKEKGKLKNWVLIDHTELKDWFKKVENKNELQKLALFSVIKESMKQGKNILLEEMSKKTAKKYLKNYITKYKYELITFEFVVDNFEISYLRDLQRVRNKEDKNQRKTLGKKFIEENHKMHKNKLDRDCIFVNTTKLGKRQVVNLIVKKIGLK